MTFNKSELDEALGKIIATSLFSVLTEEQRKQFYESAFHMIDRCCYCEADDIPDRIRSQLSEALRERLADQLSEMCTLKSKR